VVSTKVKTAIHELGTEEKRLRWRGRGRESERREEGRGRKWKGYIINLPTK
jgi:hypothetical protein